MTPLFFLSGLQWLWSSCWARYAKVKNWEQTIWVNSSSSSAPLLSTGALGPGLTSVLPPRRDHRPNRNATKYNRNGHVKWSTWNFVAAVFHCFYSGVNTLWKEPSQDQKSIRRRQDSAGAVLWTFLSLCFLYENSDGQIQEAASIFAKAHFTLLEFTRISYILCSHSWEVIFIVGNKRQKSISQNWQKNKKQNWSRLWFTAMKLWYKSKTVSHMPL